jgi:hypothetical protein
MFHTHSFFTHRAREEHAKILKTSQEGPLLIVRWIVKRPVLFMLTMILIGVVFTVGVGSVWKLTDPGDQDYYIRNAETVIAVNKYELAFDEIGATEVGVEIPLRSVEELRYVCMCVSVYVRVSVCLVFNPSLIIIIPLSLSLLLRWFVFLMFKAKNGDVFAKTTWDAMVDVEKIVTGDDEYKMFCYAGGASPACATDAHNTFTGLLDTSDSDSKFEREVQGLADNYKTAVGSFFGVEFNDKNPESEYARSFFKFGSPIGDKESTREFDNEEDRDVTQDTRFANWLADVLSDLNSEDSNNSEVFVCV